METLMHCCWECKVVHPHWKTEQQCPEMQGLSYDPARHMPERKKTLPAQNPVHGYAQEH